MKNLHTDLHVGLRIRENRHDKRQHILPVRTCIGKTQSETRDRILCYFKQDETDTEKRLIKGRSPRREEKRGKGRSTV